MNTMTWMQICLIMHLTGLTLMAGTTAAEYITFGTFCKLVETEKEPALRLLRLLKKLSGLLGAGAGLLILSGTGLLLITDGAFLHQLWFKIKLALILVLILNGFLVGSRQGQKLNNGLIENDAALTKNAMRSLKLFYMVQMGIFFTIIILAVCKFN